MVRQNGSFNLKENSSFLSDPAIEIKQVVNRNDLSRFIEFPYRLYRNEPTWVPPLRMTQQTLFNPNHLFWRKNPHRFFLAIKNGNPVGRIAAFINHEHNNFHKSQLGFFGFLESENDESIFALLLASAESFIKQNNCSEINGPFNPSLHYELGTLINGFEKPPYFMLTHNFNYYDPMIVRAGYSKLKDFYCYKFESSQYKPTEKMTRVNAYLKQKFNVRIRQGNKDSFDKELEIFYSIYNDAFSGHWGFTPIDKQEFIHLAKDLKAIVDTRFILIAEINKEPVAFVLCLPNLNEVLINIHNGKLFPWGIFKLWAGIPRIKTLRVITAAVKSSYDHLGLGALLYPELIKQALEHNFKESELSWIAEGNTKMISVAEDLGAVNYKTYRVYSKSLSTLES